MGFILINDSVLILKLAINRLNIHRIKRAEASQRLKKEIADLLEQGKDQLARVRVREIILWISITELIAIDRQRN